MDTDFRYASRSNRSAGEVNTICDAIKALLERRDLKNYVNSILTAHAVKSPPDLEAALRLLAQLQGMPFLYLNATR